MLDVQNAQTPNLLKETCVWPIYQEMTATYIFWCLASPKKTASNCTLFRFSRVIWMIAVDAKAGSANTKG
jgi:hypothetical protein